MVRNQLSLVLVILLILEACFALPVFSKTYTDGSGNVLDEAAFDPAGVVAEGSSYRKAVNGDKNIRYRILRSYSVRMETGDGGTSWNPAAYWKTTSGGKVEPRLSTLEFEMDLPTPNAVDVQTSAYTNLTPWRGLYYPVSDKQNIDASESELNDLKDAYNKEVYSFSANIYSIVPAIISRDEAAGTTRIKVSIQFSLPRDGTICENQIPDAKYNPYLEKNTDIKLLSGCDEEEISADAKARAQYLLYGYKINEYLKKYAESIWNNDTEGADSIYKKCKEHVNTENFGTLKKRFEDMKATQTASREFLDAHYRTWIESEYAAINADYENQMKNMETYTHKWFDAWLAEYNREHPTAQYHPTAADMQEIYQNDRDAYTEYMQKEYGDAFQNGSVKITEEAYAAYRYQSMLSWVQKVTDEYFSYSWNLPFTISYQIGKKCEYCGDMLDPDAEDNHCTDSSCSYYKANDDRCGCCQYCSKCKEDFLKGYGNTVCSADTCSEWNTEHCGCYKPPAEECGANYSYGAEYGNYGSRQANSSWIQWTETHYHIWYCGSEYCSGHYCYHYPTYRATVTETVNCKNGDATSWSTAFTWMKSGYGFGTKVNLSGTTVCTNASRSCSHGRTNGSFYPDNYATMPTSVSSTQSWGAVKISKNQSYDRTAHTQPATVAFERISGSRAGAAIPYNGTVSIEYQPVQSGISRYGYRNIYTALKTPDSSSAASNRNCTTVTTQGGTFTGLSRYSGLPRGSSPVFKITKSRRVLIKGNLSQDDYVMNH